MSIGGRVVKTNTHPDLRDIKIVVAEELEASKFLAIHIEKNEASLGITIGDVIWWQSEVAYWIPMSGPRDGEQDIPIRRLSNSYPVDRQGIEVRP